jgi:hypothetical protein
MRSLATLSVPDLHRLEQLEMDVRNRDKVLDAIDTVARASCEFIGVDTMAKAGSTQGDTEDNECLR